jgi:hypothetical protein
MGIVGAVVSLALIVYVLVEGFETMVLPRRVGHGFRFTRLFYRGGWRLWRRLALGLPAGRRREACLSWFGPLSILSLIASWVLGLIVAFGLLHWSLETPVHVQAGRPGLGTYVYLSGVTFFTLGYGDVVPTDRLGSVLTVVEAGVGFGFMAVVIGYLPVLYAAFSRREATISMLDARAGSPPSAAQLLLRLAQGRCLDSVHPFLAEWERWSAELLESHLSFPVLSYYRCQHDNQSWVAALTAILDTCALVIAGVKDVHPYQAQLTFAMARHAVVDLALVFHTPPVPPDPDRLAEDRLRQVRELLAAEGLVLREGAAAAAKLVELRGMYEPFVNALARHFLFALPPVLPDKVGVDNWQTSAWMRRTAGLGKLTVAADGDEHFD